MRLKEKKEIEMPNAQDIGEVIQAKGLENIALLLGNPKANDSGRLAQMTDRVLMAAREYGSKIEVFPYKVLEELSGSRSISASDKVLQQGNYDSAFVAQSCYCCLPFHYDDGFIGLRKLNETIGENVYLIGHPNYTGDLMRIVFILDEQGYETDDLLVW